MSATPQGTGSQESSAVAERVGAWTTLAWSQGAQQQVSVRIKSGDSGKGQTQSKGHPTSLKPQGGSGQVRKPRQEVKVRTEEAEGQA